MKSPKQPAAETAQAMSDGILKWAKGHDLTMSLLYDLDLMPEQVEPWTREWCRMLTTISHMQVAATAQENSGDLSGQWTPTGEPVSLRWETGTPEVKEGGRQAFWCAVKNHRGGISHVAIEYLNRHVMPCSDSCEPGDSAIPVPGSDDEYFWTGWFEQSCEHCETQWNYTGEVVAWIRLPRFPANSEAETRSGDQRESPAR